MNLFQVKMYQISSTKRARKPLKLPKPAAMPTKNLQFKILRKVIKKVPEFAIKMLDRHADREKQEVHNQNQESRLMSRVELGVFCTKPKA